jgi:CubicO group peptidase (beta-lactamase class C family)
LLPFDPGVQSASVSAAEAYWPTGEWRRSTPRQQGLNAEMITSLVNRIRQRQIRDLDSLLVVRNGYLIVEEYFNGWGPDNLHTLQSDTKSITSLLTGVAIQQGLLRGLRLSVVALFA